MCCAGILARNLKKYAASMCDPVPTPAEPKLMVLPFADFTKSARLPAGLLGLVVSASGLDAAMATVLKSVRENGLFSCSVSLMASAVVVAKSV